jgi:hypothetical protein
VAWQSAETTIVTSRTFSSEDAREEEEALAREMILSAVAEACGVAPSGPDSTIMHSVDRREQHALAEWTELLLGQRQFISPTDKTPIILPGSFNPLHTAHKRMAEIAEKRYGLPVTFELSITNVDKPALDFVELADRLAQFPDRQVLLTRLSTFVEKAKISPGSTFVVGIDTMVRIANPTYYGGDTVLRDAAIESIAKRSGCRFLVFGRVMDGEFRTLSEIELPTALRDICEEVPATVFREDVSSTELRRA